MRIRWYVMRERSIMFLVWLLPRWLVYWCAIRVAANATTGQWSHQIVPDLTVEDALKRWRLG